MHLIALTMALTAASPPPGAAGEAEGSAAGGLCLPPSVADAVGGVLEPAGARRTLAGGWTVGDTAVEPGRVLIPWTGPDGKRATLILERPARGTGGQWFRWRVDAGGPGVTDADRLEFARMASEIDRAFAGDPWTSACKDGPARGTVGGVRAPPCPFCPRGRGPVLPVFASGPAIPVALALLEIAILCTAAAAGLALAARVWRALPPR
jgi:hypothetical protein